MSINSSITCQSIAGRLSDCLVLYYRKKKGVGNGTPKTVYVRYYPVLAFIGPLLWAFDTIRAWNIGFGPYPPLCIHERDRGSAPYLHCIRVDEI
jgi:hypothetical protein